MDRAWDDAAQPVEIAEGSDLYSADGDRIGTVDEVRETYLVAHQGRFFGKQLFIPHEAVDRVQDGRVYVRAARHEVDAQHWDVVRRDD